ncbi:MAG: pyridoxamine 5'-phosphate oxidase [Planctomycetaceae bacterium]|nr:pyridoxamine 5'-phosphate oxidase [Planctomycetaceae bacterium]
MDAGSLSRIRQLIADAGNTGSTEPVAMTLATVAENGGVSARVVLLRGVDERGFVFYTNLNSEKGRQLEANPAAALCFHWDPLKEQVRVEGTVEQVSEDEADEYWKARPRDSRIGAWASRQSETLESRAVLVQRVAEFEVKFEGQDVPRPDFWSGFRVVPNRIEFWKSMPARLHERIVYELGEDGWTKRMLYP